MMPGSDRPLLRNSSAILVSCEDVSVNFKVQEVTLGIWFKMQMLVQKGRDDPKFRALIRSQ